MENRYLGRPSDLTAEREEAAGRFRRAMDQFQRMSAIAERLVGLPIHDTEEAIEKRDLRLAARNALVEPYQKEVIAAFCASHKLNAFKEKP